MDILDVIGDFGRYQSEVLAVLMTRSLLMVGTLYVVHMSSENIDHWCRPVGEYGNLSALEWKNCCVPKSDRGFSHCQRYDFLRDGTIDNNTLVKCQEWEYEDPQTSLKAEWDIVCDRKWLQSVMYLVFFAGNLICYPISGYFADRYGRKTMLMFGCLGLSVTNTAVWLSNSLICFLIFRFMSGLAYSFLHSVSYTIYTEIVGRKHRRLVIVFTGILPSFARCFFAAFSALVNRWRHLALLVSFPMGLPFLALYWKFILESPRWLIAKQDKREASIVIDRIARKNKIQIHDMDSVLNSLQKKIIEENENSAQQSDDMKKFMKDKKAAFGFGILMVSCFVVWFSYSGSYIALRSLDIHYNIGMVAGSGFTILVDLLGIMILSSSIGRRQLQIFSFGLSGAFYLLSTVFLQDIQWLCITLTYVATALNHMAMHISIILMGEFFPTTVRSRGTSACLMVARVGSVSSSFIDLMSQTVGPKSPFYLFGGLSLFVAFCYIFLIETDKNSLPDTVAESKRCLEEKGVPEVLYKRVPRY